MGLIVDGIEYEVSGLAAMKLRVVNWHESKLTWKLGDCGTRLRLKPPQWWVWHWTAGDPSTKAPVGARGCYNTLTRRGLSIQLFIAYDGTIYQYVDLAWGCAHAGTPTNDASIGVEMQNCGHGRPNPRVPRARLPETVHGVTRPTSQFTAQQFMAAQLLRGFAAGYYHTLPINTLHDTTVVSVRRRKLHSGDLAHYQISDDKRDAGTHFMDHVVQWR